MTEELIPQNPNGCFPDEPDSRDYIYEEVCGLGEPIDWSQPFEIAISKIENQNGSSSCCGQAWSKYLEVLEQKENNRFTDLSAKFIYSQTFLPNGGSYLRGGAKIAVKQGCCTEQVLSSYPATEENMRKVEDITDEIKNNALTYKSKSYASLWHKQDIEMVARVIRDNNGAVTGVYGDNEGWKSSLGGWVKPPVNKDPWGHALYLTGYGQKDGRKYIKFVNSWANWGDQGYGYLCEDYFKTNNVFSLWTLIDSPNVSMAKIIGDKNTGKQYVVGEDNKGHWIFNLVILNQLHDAGMVNKNEVEWRDDIGGLEIGDPWAVIKDRD